MNDIICPKCNGAGSGIAHINRGSQPHAWQTIDCRSCKGSGRISAEYMERIEDGELKRQERIAQQLSLREMAALLGITPRELSEMENPKP